MRGGAPGDGELAAPAVRHGFEAFHLRVRIDAEMRTPRSAHGGCNPLASNGIRVPDPVPSTWPYSMVRGRSVT